MSPLSALLNRYSKSKINYASSSCVPYIIRKYRIRGTYIFRTVEIGVRAYAMISARVATLWSRNGLRFWSGVAEKYAIQGTKPSLDGGLYRRGARRLDELWTHR